MSAHTTPFLTGFLASIVRQLPLLLVWLVGIGLALVHRSRAPRASLLLIVGLVISGVLALANSVLTGLVQSLATSGPTARIGMIVSVASVVQTLVGAVAWALMIAAVLVERAR